MPITNHQFFLTLYVKISTIDSPNDLLCIFFLLGSTKVMWKLQDVVSPICDNIYIRYAFLLVFPPKVLFYRCMFSFKKFANDMTPHFLLL